MYWGHEYALTVRRTLERDRAAAAAGTAQTEGRSATAARPQALTGSLFVLRTGCPWEALPAELGCGSGVTRWRRLRAWQAAGVWDRIHQSLLDRLGSRGRIDWSRASIDTASVPAKRRP
jgi:transposase